MSEVGCLLIPRFPLACELAEQPHPPSDPIVVLNEGRVWVASEAAERHGVRSGQRSREALGYCPSLIVLEGRPARYRAQNEALLDALCRVVPGVEPGAEGVAYLDLDGLDRAYPVRTDLYRAILGCAPIALRPRLAMAPTKFAAWVAAYLALPGNVRTVAPGEAATFLGPQSVELLPVSPEMLRRLRLLGLRTVGAVGAIRKTALVAQFGREGKRAWELARGLEVDPLRPVVPEERIVESLDFLDPLISRDALLVAAEQALNRALRAPLLAGRAIRGTLLRLETERGAIWERATTFGEALAERDRLWRVLRVVLDEVKIPGPIAALRLELRGLAPIHGRQLELFPGPRDRRAELEECLRQLGARYGACPVSRIVEVEPWSRIPERRLALIDYDP